MFLLAAVRRPRGPDIPVKVRNLSSGGMMAEFSGGLVRGDAVEVDLRGIGTVAGKVAWTAPGRLGVQFDAPVDPRLARVVPHPSAAAQTMLVRASRSTWRPGLR